MKVLTVVSHPRRNSLTFAAAEKLVQGLKDAGHDTEILDLHRIGFNPVLWEADEPDISVERPQYSPEVEREIERMDQFDGLAYVFPLWWYSLPAMLKGYIDRVWNYGYAYGTSKLHHQHVLWLILAAAGSQDLTKRKYDEMIDHYLHVGLADYVGIPDSKVAYLYETLKGDPKHIEQLLDQAYQQGLNYGKE
ncbi:Putative NADPH-quinone reductase (modulator of drug activity B) [Seinonella peptonophila]|uniref:Putative NADPH-quinone reductase (Modulator of drug activity B) n=1 Tax=Seinonella peptonophila TaxID=112248 RepID=A0A1M4X1U9_9BACL|nr:NAD(P)H oxidoreductase [Seinonella peptonophila]SHE87182.1 Putative NADPH-quinone reductase (modulator of drug activity B) [Seinonella peptonophila]